VKGDIVKELLPMIDNFELARTQVKAETEGEQKINNSYQSLYKQMVEAMKAFGVEAVATVGGPFDPNLHEAIMREPSEEVEDGTVLMEFRKGFMLGDRLLRPAMVKVSYSEAPAAPAAATEEVKQEEPALSE
jgi:molecular chaperone GrpE